MLLGEAFYQAARVLGDSRWGNRWALTMHALSMQAFARQAYQVCRRRKPGVYHYRAGYASPATLESLRRRGWTLLCDHSIAHPRALPVLLDNDGRLPLRVHDVDLDPMNARVERDLLAADYVVVNSDFVKETCVWAGMDEDRLLVLYAGVEPDVLEVLASQPIRDIATAGRPLRVLCAGRMEDRKGTRFLAAALTGTRLQNVEVTFVGSWDPGLLSIRETLAECPGVTIIDHMDRLHLATFMQSFDVFVFPSLAEGSARVIGMAMAAGCAIAATRNSGGFYRADVDGRLLQPGDAGDIARVLQELEQDRDFVRQAGASAARRVHRDYQYGHYADRLKLLYESLPGGPRRGR
jgi:glycosyltransferase involved in cell wall biosynthesis